MVQKRDIRLQKSAKKIMSDNHVRKYSKLSKKDKEKKRLVVWGF